MATIEGALASKLSSGISMELSKLPTKSRHWSSGSNQHRVGTSFEVAIGNGHWSFQSGQQKVGTGALEIANIERELLDNCIREFALEFSK